MKIRVAEKSINEQLKKVDTMYRSESSYTIGGDLGISRILMLLLEKSYIFEA